MIPMHICGLRGRKIQITITIVEGSKIMEEVSFVSALRF